MDRDAFIAAMISHLQEEESLELKAESVESTFTAVCNRMQRYDFPDISDREAGVLIQVIQDAASGDDILLQRHFRINEKFLENTKYLSTHSKSPGIQKMLRALYIDLPLYLLDCNFDALVKYFEYNHGWDEVPNWPAVLGCFSAFCETRSLSSMICKDHSPNIAPADEEYFASSEIFKLVDLLSVICSGMPGQQRTTRFTIETVRTFRDLFHFISYEKSIPVEDEDINNSHLMHMQVIVSDLFFRVGLLIRDLMLFQQSLIVACIPRFCDAVGFTADHSTPPKMSESQQMLLIAVFGSVLDAISAVDDHKNAASMKDTRSFLAGHFSEVIVGFVLVCEHLLLATDVRSSGPEIKSLSENNSITYFVRKVLCSVGFLYIDTMLPITTGPEVEGSRYKTFNFEHVFNNSGFLSLLQRVACDQFKRCDGKIDSKLCRLFACLLLQYSADVALFLLRRDTGNLIDVVLRLDIGPRKESTDTTVDAPSETYSCQVLHTFGAYSMTFLIGLIYGVLQILARIDHSIDSALSSGESLPSLLSNVLERAVDELNMILESAGHKFGSEIISRAPQGSASPSSIAISGEFAQMMSDLLRVGTIIRYRPQWFQFMFDKPISSSAESSDIFRRSKSRTMKIIQEWVYALSSVATVPMAPAVTQFSAEDSKSSSVFEFSKSGNDDSDWEWDVVEGKEEGGSRLTYNTEKTDCVSDGDISLVISNEETGVNSKELPADNMHDDIERDLKEKSDKPLVSSVQYNKIRVLLKLLKSMIAGALNDDCWLANAANKID